MWSVMGLKNVIWILVGLVLIIVILMFVVLLLFGGVELLFSKK